MEKEEKRTALEVPVQEQSSININQLRIKNGLNPIPNGDIDLVTQSLMCRFRREK